MRGGDLASYLQAARSGLGLLRSLIPKKQGEESEPPPPLNLSEGLRQLQEELSAGESSKTPFGSMPITKAFHLEQGKSKLT